jgi:hypothetical protein
VWNPADWINPVAIKEIRQALRGRTFGVAFGLLLTGCVVLSLLAWSVDTAASVGFSSLPMDGQTIVWPVGLFLGLVSCLAIPAAVARAFALERSEVSRAVIDLTPLTARQVLRGKIVSALVQGALLLCAGGPFLVFGYFLQNVSLAAIFVLMGGLILAQLFFATMLISLSAFAGTKQLRRINVLGAFFGVVALSGMNFAFEVVRFYGGRGVSSFDPTILAAAVAGLLSFALIAHELGAAKLSLPTTDTTGGVRLALALHLLMVLFWAVDARGTSSSKAPIAVLLYGCVLIGAIGMQGLLTADALSFGLRGRSRWSRFLLPGARNAWHFTLLAVIGWAVLVRAAAGARASLGGDLLYLTVPSLMIFYLALAALGRSLMREHGQLGIPLLSLLLAIVVFTPGMETISSSMSDRAIAFPWRYLSLGLPVTMPAPGSPEHRVLVWEGAPFQVAMAVLIALLVEVRLRNRELEALAREEAHER